MTKLNINEMRARRRELLGEADMLLANAKQSGKDLAGAELQRYDAIIAQVEDVAASIQRHDYLTGLRGADTPEVLPTLGEVQQTQRAMSSPRGFKSGLHEVYALASGAQRAEIDALAQHLTGRQITAAADLRPSHDGGLAIPTYVVRAVERDYAQFAPVVSVARIWGTDTGAATVFPVLSDSEAAVLVDAAAATGADDTVSGDTPPTAFTGPTLDAYKLSSKPVFVPRETWTDAAVDIVNEVVGALLARIIRAENALYTTGTGSAQHQGVVTGATKYVAGSVALDLDVALDLAYSVPPLYRTRGIYMMSDTTAKYLRKLKTGLSGDKRQLWADADATKGTPATLHGYPVVINDDMASVAADGTFAAGIYPVVFGDFSKFVVRQAEQNQPFIYRYPVPAKDGAGIILFRRSDSRILVPTAINKLAAS
jgi:HK97 family phage major capsid protein